MTMTLLLPQGNTLSKLSSFILHAYRWWYINHLYATGWLSPTGCIMLIWLTKEASTSQPFPLFSSPTHIHWPNERNSFYGPTPELNNNASLVLYNVVGPNTTFTSFGFKAPEFWVETFRRWGSRLKEILDLVYAWDGQSHTIYNCMQCIIYIP